jgi:hypothetical protein
VKRRYWTRLKAREAFLFVPINNLPISGRHSELEISVLDVILSWPLP